MKQSEWIIDDYIECLENGIYFCESEKLPFIKTVQLSPKAASEIVKMLKELRELREK